MSIVDSEKLLFEEWRKLRPDLVMDGVADESRYIQSKPHLLFIKEKVDNLAGWGSDQRQFMRDGASLAAWENIARWTRGIRTLPDAVLWHELKTSGLTDGGQELASVAVMNLRKSHSVIAKRSDAAAERRLLNRQFALYDADVVILCGSAVTGLFDKLIDLHRARRWQFTSLSVRFKRYGKKKVVVEHCLPYLQGHTPYYSLIHAIYELLWRGKLKLVFDDSITSQQTT